MNDDVKAILSAGYLIERKGHHRVARALAGLRARSHGAELWVVGGPGREDDYADNISWQVTELGVREAVHFVGAVPPEKLAEYMTAAGVMCRASTREGWPNVVNEALGCGCPVVAFDVGGIAGMLSSPEYGIVVPAGDQAGLEEALRRAIAASWDRERIAAHGQARSWSQVGAEAVAELQIAAARPARSGE